jgi:hypothetical protein
MNNIIKIVKAYYPTIVGMIALYILMLLVSTILEPVFPVESQYKSKIAHGIIGLLFAWLFWYAIEQHQRAHLVNPFWLLFGCIWGASGFFFIRWGLQLVGVRFGRPSGVYDTLLYRAFPDWDWLFHAHRNFFTHSAILPILLMIFAVYKKWRPLRDIGMGLAVGIASHLVWDVISVANYPYQYIRHLDGYAGALWSLSNAILGVFIAYYLVGKSSLPFEPHKDSMTDSIGDLS